MSSSNDRKFIKIINEGTNDKNKKERCPLLVSFDSENQNRVREVVIKTEKLFNDKEIKKLKLDKFYHKDVLNKKCLYSKISDFNINTSTNETELKIKDDVLNRIVFNNETIKIYDINNKKIAAQNFSSGKVEFSKITGDKEILEKPEKFFEEENSLIRQEILENIKSKRMLFSNVPERFKNDKEIVLEAVKNDGEALEFASEELKNDKEIVLEAVKKNGRALGYASKELQNDKEIVLEAVRQEGGALGYASKELRNNEEFKKEIKNLVTVDDISTIVDEKRKADDISTMVNEKGKMGGFAIPFYESINGKRKKVGEKKAQYSEKENVFEYTTSSGQHLMKVTLKKSTTGIEKILEIDNTDGRFDSFKEMIEKDSSIGKIAKNIIKIKIDDIRYNPTSEIIVSLSKEIETDNVLYDSINILTNQVVLARKKSAQKLMYTTAENETINSTLPANFYQLVADKKIEADKIPTQQLQALVDMGDIGLPKGVVAVKRYNLSNKAAINCLVLKDSSGRKRLFANMGPDVVEMDTIYRVPDKDNFTRFVFGPTVYKKDSEMGRFSKSYEVKGIDESHEGYKTFKKEVLSHNKDFNFIYEADFSKTKNKIVAPTKRTNRNKIIINKSVGDLSEEKDNKLVPDPAPPPQTPTPEAPPAPAPASPVVSTQRPKGRFRKFLKVLKYIAYGIGAAAFIGLGIMTAGVGLVQGAMFGIVGYNLFQGMTNSIISDRKESLQTEQAGKLSDARKNIEKLEKELETYKQAIEELQKNAIESSEFKKDAEIKTEEILDSEKDKPEKDKSEKDEKKNIMSHVTASAATAAANKVENKEANQNSTEKGKVIKLENQEEQTY